MARGRNESGPYTITVPQPRSGFHSRVGRHFQCRCLFSTRSGPGDRKREGASKIQRLPQRRVKTMKSFNPAPGASLR